MELKQEIEKDGEMYKVAAFNRTIMELKLSGIPASSHAFLNLLIVPLWNWNCWHDKRFLYVF